MGTVFKESIFKQKQEEMPAPEETMIGDIPASVYKPRGDISFSEAVDNIIADTDDSLEAIKVCETPDILVKVGCEKLPMFYTKRHLKKALLPENRRAHTHGIDADVLKKIPELLSKPVLIYDSETQKDSIVVLTSETDKRGKPLVVAIKLNGEGVYNLKNEDTNFIASIYGLADYNEVLAKINRHDHIIYVDNNLLTDFINKYGSDKLRDIDADGVIHVSQNLIHTYMIENQPDIDSAAQNLQVEVTMDKPQSPDTLALKLHAFMEAAQNAGNPRLYNQLSEALESSKVRTDGSKTVAVNVLNTYKSFVDRPKKIQEQVQKLMPPPKEMSEALKDVDIKKELVDTAKEMILKEIYDDRPDLKYFLDKYEFPDWYKNKDIAKLASRVFTEADFNERKENVADLIYAEMENKCESIRSEVVGLENMGSRVDKALVDELKKSLTTPPVVSNARCKAAIDKYISAIQKKLPGNASLMMEEVMVCDGDHKKALRSILNYTESHFSIVEKSPQKEVGKTAQKARKTADIDI